MISSKTFPFFCIKDILLLYHGIILDLEQVLVPNETYTSVRPIKINLRKGFRSPLVCPTRTWPVFFSQVYPSVITLLFILYQTRIILDNSYINVTQKRTNMDSFCRVMTLFSG